MNKKPVQAKQKVIVAIPTKNRPGQYLRAALHSVAEQAARFGHDVEIVVSDLSDGEIAQKNERLIEKLCARFPSVPIHHYPQGATPIDKALEGASQPEIDAFENLTPTDGRWGANRNRLALLAAYHGGKNAAYLHLDDDTPLLHLDTGITLKRVLKATKRLASLKKPYFQRGIAEKSGADVIGQFLKGLAKARQRGYNGFAGRIKGVPSGQTSVRLRKRTGTLRTYLEHPEFYKGSHGGPGRILSFQGISKPYEPRCTGETQDHNKDAKVFTGGKKLFNLTAHPTILHIGMDGYTPPLNVKFAPFTLRAYYKAWESLAEKMAEMGKKKK